MKVSRLCQFGIACENKARAKVYLPRVGLRCCTRCVAYEEGMGMQAVVQAARGPNPDIRLMNPERWEDLDEELTERNTCPECGGLYPEDMREE